MPLREELRAKKPDAALLLRLEALCVAVIERVESGAPCADLLAEIEREAGRRYEAEYFFELHGFESPADFAARVALGEAPFVPDIRREELIELVDLVRIGIPPEADYYLEIFERNVSHPEPRLLVHGHKKYWPAGHRPSAEEIVEKAISADNVILL